MEGFLHFSGSLWDKPLEDSLQYCQLAPPFLLHAIDKETLSQVGSFIRLSEFQVVTSPCTFDHDCDPDFSIVLSNEMSHIHLSALTAAGASKWLEAIDAVNNPPLDTSSPFKKSQGGDGALTSRSKRDFLNLKFGIGQTNSGAGQTGIEKAEEATTMYSLRMEVSEAKNLRQKSSTNFTAMVSVEKEVHRTRNVTANNADPLWAEPFQLQVERPEQYPLNVTVWDSNTLLGRLTLPLEPLLANPVTKGTWFPIYAAAADYFVSGDLKVRCEKPMGSDVITVTIMEGNNLARRGALTHYLVKVSYAKQEKKTKTMKRSLNTVWNEPLTFKFQGMVPILCQIFPTGKFGKTGSMVGQVTIPPSVLHESYFQDNLVLEASAKHAEKEADPQQVGEVRLDIAFNKHKVYPSSHYRRILQFLLDQPLRVVAIFEKSTLVAGRDRIANNLVRIFESRNQAPTILNAMITHETISADGLDTLFRSNTIGTKAIDMFMKLVAMQYLRDIVEPTVHTVYKERKSFEVDPNKVEKGEDVKKNSKALMDVLEPLLERIYASENEMPNSLRIIFQHIFEEVSKRFPDEAEAKYIGVSSFLFLRFFCAALMGPKLFALVEDHPEAKVSKSLTMLSRVLVKMAGMVTPEIKGKNTVADLNAFIVSHHPRMREFLNSCATPKDDSNFNPAAVNIKRSLADLVAYFEEELPTSLRELYLQENVDIDTLDYLISLLDEMAITDEGRKPVLRSLRTERRFKGMTAADSSAFDSKSRRIRSNSTSTPLASGSDGNDRVNSRVITRLSISHSAVRKVRKRRGSLPGEFDYLDSRKNRKKAGSRTRLIVPAASLSDESEDSQ